MITVLNPKATPAAVTLWLRATATAIGPGFHPDTPASDYEPPLADEDARRLDDGLDIVFAVLNDPYAAFFAE